MKAAAEKAAAMEVARVVRFVFVIVDEVALKLDLPDNIVARARDMRVSPIRLVATQWISSLQ